jgi:hypothetical protein
MAAIMSKGDLLKEWANGWARHVQALRGSLGRAIGGLGAALDLGRALDRGAEIIETHGIEDEGIVAETGARLLGGVHVATHVLLTKNPIALGVDLIANLATGGRVSVDAALTEVEDAIFRGTSFISQKLGEAFADSAVERGHVMTRDGIVDAIRRTSARSDLSEEEKAQIVTRLRGLLSQQ